MYQRIFSLLTVSSILFSAGCTTPTQSEQEGTFAINIQWPEQQSNDFSIKTIPSDTRAITVRITGDGLSTAIEKTITRTNGSAPEKLNMRLPVGKKTVGARALNDKKVILAEASEDVMIESGKTTAAELDLKVKKEKEESASTNDNSSRSVAAPPASSPGESGGPTKPSGDGPAGPPSIGPGPAGPPPATNTPPGPLPPATDSNLPPLPPPALSTGSGLPSANNSGGGNSSSGPNLSLIEHLSADPNPVSGTGYPTEIKVNLPVGVNVASGTYSWSCSGPEACNNFDTNAGLRVVWTAPSTGGVYTITATKSDGTALSMDITVNSGTVNAAFNGELQ